MSRWPEERKETPHATQRKGRSMAWMFMWRASWEGRGNSLAQSVQVLRGGEWAGGPLSGVGSTPEGERKEARDDESEESTVRFMGGARGARGGGAGREEDRAGEKVGLATVTEGPSEDSREERDSAGEVLEGRVEVGGTEDVDRREEVEGREEVEEREEGSEGVEGMEDVEEQP